LEEEEEAMARRVVVMERRCTGARGVPRNASMEGSRTKKTRKRTIKLKLSRILFFL
jgi:hypothetical protein